MIHGDAQEPVNRSTAHLNFGQSKLSWTGKGVAVKNGQSARSGWRSPSQDPLFRNFGQLVQGIVQHRRIPRRNLSKLARGAVQDKERAFQCPGLAFLAR